MSTAVTMDQDLIARVENALAEVRPFLNSDGGDAKLEEITDDMVARIRLIGACSECSMSHVTVKGGLEETVKRFAPEITAVEAVDHECQ